jgi:hypothetical protein
MPVGFDVLILRGDVLPGAVGDYVRLTGLGPEAHYVGVKKGDLLPESSPIPNGNVTLWIPNTSELALSDYPLPASTLVLPNLQGPVDLPNESSPSAPPPHGYELIDGSPLTLTTDTGRIVGFSGKSGSGHVYEVTTRVDVYTADGRAKGVKATWLTAQMSLVKDGGTPLTLAIEYAAHDLLFRVVLSKDNVVNTVDVDLSAAVSAAGTAMFTRTFNYYNVNFSTQSFQIAASNANPPVHIPSMATLWPCLPDLLLFQEAFARVAGATLHVGGSPEVGESPITALGTGLYYGDATALPSVATYQHQMTTIVAPSIGPLAASCFSPGGALQYAAQWLGALLLSGPGATAAQAEAKAVHDADVAFRAAAHPSDSPHSSPKTILDVTGSAEGSPIHNPRPD